MTERYDYLVIGSGFGGSVSALRLAEKGWRVAVLEQGQAIGPAEIRAAKGSLRRLLWSPALGLRGFLSQTVFRHLVVLGGVGVGGGSLVWGAVMLEPKAAFYDDPALAGLSVDWRQELRPHFDTARRMLGVCRSPVSGAQDVYLREAAARLGRESSHGPVSSAICFNDPASPAFDTYFDGNGPPRRGCRLCGGCLTGCEYGAKNSLDYNYLYFARKLGVPVLADRRASRLEPLPEGGYRVTVQCAEGGEQTFEAGRVVLAAGVVGTLRLLLENRDHFGTLPALSPALGRVVRTNSEAITGVWHPAGEDLTRGPAISSDFYPDATTHVTQNRVDRGYRLMRAAVGPMVDDDRPLRRALRTLLALPLKLPLLASNLFARHWERRVTLLTVMQSAESHLSMRLARPWWMLRRPVLVSSCHHGQRPPSYLPIANRVAREYAAAAGGEPFNFLSESLFGKSTTAHVLSGCPMGEGSEAVIGTDHQVHGYPGLYVVDGASVPANVGVNPSLTIAAMAERFAALQPAAHSVETNA